MLALNFEIILILLVVCRRERKRLEEEEIKDSTMSATIIGETVMVATQETLNTTSSSGVQIEIESTNCDCCGLSEECTPEYIERIRQRYAGKWICGLCAEAVKDEIVKSDRLMSSEEALARHLNVCKKFRCSWPPAIDPTVHLITAVRQMLRRSLECPRGGVRSTPASPNRGGGTGGGQEKILEGISLPLARSESCFPALSTL